MKPARKINPQQCIVCEKQIPFNQHFARINHKGDMVTLCCPLCYDTFHKKPGYYIARIEAFNADKIMRNYLKNKD